MTTLYIRGEHYDPFTAPVSIAVSPTYIRRRGDITSAHGHSATAKDGIWSLEIKSITRTPIEEVNRILDLVGPGIVNARNLPGVEHAYVDLYCSQQHRADDSAGGIPIRSGAVEIQLERPVLKRLADLGLDLFITTSIGWDETD